MDSLPRRRGFRAWSVLGLVLLLVQTVLLGCSDDDPPTRPQPSSGSWQDLGLSAGFVEVDALTTWNGLLIVGGIFDNVQGNPYSNLLTWDGSTWNRLEPFGVGVRALAVYDGDLIVGSGFNPVNGDTLPTIAAWDGTQWTPLGSDLNHGSVTALAVFEGDLIAGVRAGDGTSNVSYVARWNGTSWQSMGGTLNGYLHALTVFQGVLHVGGSFDTADGVPAKGIAAWNGSAWAPVGGGIEGGVRSVGSILALTTDGTTLFAGGDFLTAGGVPAVNVARWNGAEWDSLGAGLGHPSITVYVRALAMYGGTVVAGGVFGTDPVRRWSGSEWIPMSTLNGIVFSFAMYEGSLLAGGYLPPSGDQQANGIARWVP